MLREAKPVNELTKAMLKVLQEENGEEMQMLLADGWDSQRFRAELRRYFVTVLFNEIDWRFIERELRIQF